MKFTTTAACLYIVIVGIVYDVALVLRPSWIIAAVGIATVLLLGWAANKYAEDE